MLIHTLIKKDYTTATPYAGTHSVKNKVVNDGAVVIMDEGLYYGVITTDDLIVRPHNLIIDCITSKPMITPQHTLQQAIDLMKQYKVRVLPVCEHERFVGLIYYDNIIEHLSRMVDEQKSMVQTVAHDLKSPINSIIGLSSLLRGNIVKEENIQLLNYTDQACTYATEIINDLLLIPQLEGDQDEAKEYEPTEINTLLSDCLNGVRVQAAEKNIDIIDHISKREYYYSIHKSKFKRAINNLLINAIKFTAARGSIGITTEQNGDELLISIKDNGIGIPMHQQPFIFQKFTKAKRRGTDGEKSIGLGLYITKQIVEHHEGCIWFESDEQNGTTFYIRLGNDSTAMNHILQIMPKEVF